jgi:adenylosuccinate synthase
MKYAIMVNGVTELSMMKADVLSIFDTIQVCTHYLIDGNKVEDFPFDVDGANLTPVYEELEGWNCDLTQLDDYSKAPQALKNYVTYLEEKLEVPITVVSVGPDRKQTLNNN